MKALLSLACLAACASAFTTTTTSPRRPVRVSASVEEVSLAASQQLVALAVVAVGEGTYATLQGSGFRVNKAIKFLGPSVASGAVLLAASGSVGSGDASAMAPGLAASSLASLALFSSYVLRLGQKDKEGPPKELVALFAAIAFFGFSTAFQSLFAAGILQLPSLFESDAGVNVEGFPDISEGGGFVPDVAAES